MNRKHSSIFIAASALLLSAGVTGCAGVAKIPANDVVQAPEIERLLARHTELDDAKKPKTDSYSDVMERCRTNLLDAAQCKEKRNQLIHEMLLISDFYYHQYEGNTVAGRATTSFYTDAATTALSAAGAAIAVETTAKIFSGLSSLVSGTKTSADKNFYAEKAADALASQMRADRATIKTALYPKLAAEYSDYPLQSALTDIVAYYRAGTLASSVISLAGAAAAKEEQAKKDEGLAVQKFLVNPATR